jgi:hypothetical protein
MLISFFAATSVFAQDVPYSEEYMKQHDGRDRAEYLLVQSRKCPDIFSILKPPLLTQYASL